MSVFRLRRARAVAWSPYMLTRSVLRAWWNADDWTIPLLVTNDGDGLISSFKDRIQVINAAGTTTQRPTAAADSFSGGRAALTFNDSSNALTTASVSGLLPTGSAPGELFCVANIVGPGTMLAYGGTSGAVARRLSLNADGTYKVDDGVTAATSPVIAAGPHIFHGWFDGTSIGGSVDGVAFDSVTAADALNTGTTRLRMSSTLGTIGNYVGGPMRHFIVTTLLTQAQRDQLTRWLAADSGVSV